MTQQPTVLVTGAGGFIGHHLTRYLVDKGYKEQLERRVQQPVAGRP